MSNKGRVIDECRRQGWTLHITKTKGSYYKFAASIKDGDGKPVESTKADHKYVIWDTLATRLFGPSHKTKRKRYV